MGTMLNEMAHNYKHADVSKDQFRKMSMRKNSFVITLSREETRSLTQAEEKSVVDSAQREEIKTVY